MGKDCWPFLQHYRCLLRVKKRMEGSHTSKPSPKLTQFTMYHFDHRLPPKILGGGSGGKTGNVGNLFLKAWDAPFGTM